MNVNSKRDYASGALSLAAAGAIGYKGITSGIRRALGIRIEEHTTTAKNAKNIIKDGKILDPKFGGTKCSNLLSTYEDNSKNYIHITGLHKNTKDIFKNNELLNEFLTSKKINSNKLYDTIFNSPIKNPFSAIYRKVQRIMYRGASSTNINFDDLGKGIMGEIELDEKALKNDYLKSIFNCLTGKDCKTFYIGGTDNYFNKNFIPDCHDIALKTSKPLKVCSSKIEAMFMALKREGLSGIKQNKTRAIGGVLIAISLFSIAGKLIKNGIEKFKHNKENS